MATCRTPECKAPIMWAHTGEKWMPVDAEPAADGNILLSGGDPPKARVLAGEQLATARTTQVRLYKSHFATCVRGSAHRKKAAA